MLSESISRKVSDLIIYIMKIMRRDFKKIRSKDVINYCYHAMGEHVAVGGAITL